MLQRIRHIVHTEVKAKSKADVLARGAAIGVLTGLSPFFFCHVVLALLLAWLLRGSKALAVLLVFINNPWTLLPIYYAEGRVAEALIPYETNIFTRESVAELFLEHEPDRSFLGRIGDVIRHPNFLNYFERILAGGLIVGIPAATAVYLLVWDMARRLHRRHHPEGEDDPPAEPPAEQAR